jgi:hypothetical protein
VSTLQSRDQRVHTLASKIVVLLRESENRAEATDAHYMAKIMFRREVANSRDLTCSEVPEESLAMHP